MRCGIFVDAGYVFAQGSTALFGSKQKQSELNLQSSEIIKLLKATKERLCPNAELLRIYWYDAAANGSPSKQQFEFAFCDDVKLRLGFLNSSGQQKGVDSLIVTDMIELARNNAISDAILISGDEDLRVGVSIAQSYGVRVHLVGIHPSRGSQSQLLMQEADTKTEWSKSEVEWFLSKIVYVNTTINLDISKTPNSMGMENETLVASEVFSIVATDLVNSQDESELDLISKLNSLPREIDGKLLGISRDKLGRTLDSVEKRELRNLYRAAVNGKITK
jgi:uncharacterized LabA/DUF88 family protein